MEESESEVEERRENKGVVEESVRENEGEWRKGEKIRVK